MSKSSYKKPGNGSIPKADATDAVPQTRTVPTPPSSSAQSIERGDDEIKQVDSDVGRSDEANGAEARTVAGSSEETRTTDPCDTTGNPGGESGHGDGPAVDNCEKAEAAGPDLTDDEIIGKASKAKNGEKFQKLYRGDWSDYKTQSSAEFALCRMLAFYCGPHGRVIDRLFRRSGLCRQEKWDEPRGQTTYGRETIGKVLKSQKMFYQPSESKSDPKDDKDDPSKVPPYCALGGKTYYRKITRNNKINPVVIANFEAEIIEDLVVDDGLKELRIFKIKAKLPSGERLLEIPSRDFARMDWVLERLGSSANVSAGRVTKDHVRAAIQSLSLNVPERRVYHHTGWRKVNGIWIFLHQGGAVGAESIETDLQGERLDRYDLTNHKGNAQEAIRHSLQLFSIASPAVAYPLFAITYRAPLCHHLACTVMPHIVGPSGSYKSTLAAAVLAHYGNFSTKEHLPARWAFTGTILEKDTFLAKDVPFVIDDLNPEAVRGCKETLEANFARIIGAVGDNTGRRRATSELETRQEYHPRGLVVSTGEYTPELPPSRMARLFLVPVNPCDISAERLTQFQRQLALLPAALCAYLDFLCTDFEALREKILQRSAVIRAKAASALPPHPRLAENVAHLQLGVEWGITFALHAGMLTEAEAQNHIDAGFQVLTELAMAQGKRLVDDRPTEVFLNAIREGLMNGRCCLASRDMDEPVVGKADAGSQKIGWIDDEGVYLLPSTAYKFVNDRLSYRGGLHMTEQALKDALKREEILLHTPSEKGRTDANKRCAGVTQRVLWLRPAVLDGYKEAAAYRDEVVERLVEEMNS